MASFVPNARISGVASTPSLYAKSLIFTTLGLEANAEVILFKLYCAVIRPWSCACGSSPYWLNATSYCRFLSSTAARLASIYAYRAANSSLARPTDASDDPIARLMGLTAGASGAAAAAA